MMSTSCRKSPREQGSSSLSQRHFISSCPVNGLLKVCPGVCWEPRWETILSWGMQALGNARVPSIIPVSQKNKSQLQSPRCQLWTSQQSAFASILEDCLRNFKKMKNGLQKQKDLKWINGNYKSLLIGVEKKSCAVISLSMLFLVSDGVAIL